MELNFKQYGAGDPVIIMHGLLGSLDNWQTIAKKLAEDYMVFTVDLRNHGRSPHAEEFDYPVMAQDLKKFMEENWIFEAHIVGHSMGGKVAMQFAGQHMDMIDKLCVVDIAPKTYKGNHQPIFDALFALDLKTIDSRKEANTFLQTRIEDYGVRQFILKNLDLNRKTRSYSWKMNLEAIYNAYPKILSRTELPQPFEGETLFIRGDRSDYISKEEYDQYRKYFPEAKFETIRDAGHWVHAEQPKQFLEVLKAYLRS